MINSALREYNTCYLNRKRINIFMPSSKSSMTSQIMRRMIIMANGGLHKKPYCTVPAVCLSYDDGDDRYVATTIRYNSFLYHMQNRIKTPI